MTIEIGDLVTHVEEDWPVPHKVKYILRNTEIGDCAIFVGGGFWATDRLKKVLPDVPQPKDLT